MATFLYTHSSCIEHDVGPSHPESPARLRAVLEALAEPEFDGLERRQAPLAARAAIERMHSATYVETLLNAVPDEGRVWLDPDTAMCPASGQAALRGAGALVAAVDAVIGGQAKNAFCAVRPPGHHAERAKAMGFCLFDNVAIAAAHARAGHGLTRVAVVDFDVHHGNGTQHMFETDPDLFYASSHQYPFYPGSGAEYETGVGNVVNVGLGQGAGSSAFRAAYEGRILPALDAFAPELLIVSAGFDAHERDPLAGLELDTADFAWVTERLTEAAGRHCAGRLISALEGGYDLRALGESAAVHVAALMAAR